MSVITDLFKSGVDGAVSALGGSIKNAVSAFKADPTKLAELENALENARMAHDETLRKLGNDMDTAYLKDVDSARNMQIEALKQNDVFSKRFIYYLAGMVILIVTAFDFALFWVNYPDKNRDLINMIAGILNSTALVMVLSFFFGSSKGSKDAGERIDKMMNKISEQK